MNVYYMLSVDSEHIQFLSSLSCSALQYLAFLGSEATVKMHHLGTLLWQT